MSRSSLPVTAGFGCDRGVPLATVQSALMQALQRAGLGVEALTACASIDAKADELAFLQLGRQLALPWHWYPAAALARVVVPNPSPTVQRYMGTPSVAEAAALLAAGTVDAAALLVEKHRLRGPDGRHVTVSLARRARAGDPSCTAPTALQEFLR